MPEEELLLPVPLPQAEREMIVHKRQPENAEVPIERLNGWLTLNERFYRRNHFPYPEVDPAAWRLTVEGKVTLEMALARAQFQALPRTSQWVTVECAGNKRGYMEPRPKGEPWREGAIGNAEWGGVPLRDVLRMAAPRPEAVEVLFTGADHGKHEETGEQVHFARSLPLEVALRPEVLLADTMNGEPLPARHGGPLRLVVPGWYGMASVKWLTRIELLAEPFRGPFQVRDYVYLPAPQAYREAVPVTTQRVNSAISYPPEGVTLPPGSITLRGVAWSSRPIRRVEVSLDAGQTWQEAALIGPGAPHAWRLWQTRTPPLGPGSYTVLARATDESGAAQPLRAPWNAKGYGNNAMVPRRITIALRSARRLR